MSRMHRDRQTQALLNWIQSILSAAPFRACGFLRGVDFESIIIYVSLHRAATWTSYSTLLRASNMFLLLSLSSFFFKWIVLKSSYVNFSNKGNLLALSLYEILVRAWKQSLSVASRDCAVSHRIFSNGSCESIRRSQIDYFSNELIEEAASSIKNISDRKARLHERAIIFSRFLFGRVDFNISS